MPPGHHTAIAFQRGKGGAGAVNLADATGEAGGHRAAVAAIDAIAPSDHAAIVFQGGKGVGRAADLTDTAGQAGADCAATASVDGVPPGDHAAIVFDGSKGKAGAVNLADVAGQAGGDYTAVAAIGTAPPGDHAAIAFQRGKGKAGAVNLADAAGEAGGDGAAVAAVGAASPGDHAAIDFQCGKGVVVAVLPSRFAGRAHPYWRDAHCQLALPVGGQRDGFQYAVGTFQRPVAVHAGQVGRGGDIGLGGLGQLADKFKTTLTIGHITAIQQQIAIRGQRLPQCLQLPLHAGLVQSGGIQRFFPQLQLARCAVGKQV